MADQPDSLGERRRRKSGGRRACPVCGRDVTAEHRPFCSARCRQIDLGRWLGERYRIPTAEHPKDHSEEDEPSGDRDPEADR